MALSKKELGSLIKKARLNKRFIHGQKLTQDYLSDLLSISRSYMGDIETGRIYPRFNILSDIANICEISLGYFDQPQIIENKGTDDFYEYIDEVDTVQSCASDTSIELFKDMINNCSTEEELNNIQLNINKLIFETRAKIRIKADG